MAKKVPEKRKRETRKSYENEEFEIGSQEKESQRMTKRVKMIICKNVLIEELEESS